jgi:lipoic acid synthetase
MTIEKQTGRFPDWLKKRITAGENTVETDKLLRDLQLNTVCESAICPNQGECFAKKTATFMVMGEYCTRNCRFCAVRSGVPTALDGDEPLRVAEATLRLGLKHVVVTSVTRDDLPDGGASHFATVINCIKDKCPQTFIEVLTPDFMGNTDAIHTVVQAEPHIYNHNMETVLGLYATVRPKANYVRSLNVLEQVKKSDATILTKSGIMVGLGENEDEVIALMRDLRAIGCDIITIGQYLSPSAKHLPVKEYIHPDVFNRYKQIAKSHGFLYVASAPFVRSSYHASEVSEKLMRNRSRV